MTDHEDENDNEDENVEEVDSPTEEEAEEKELDEEENEDVDLEEEVVSDEDAEPEIARIENEDNTPDEVPGEVDFEIKDAPAPPSEVTSGDGGADSELAEQDAFTDSQQSAEPSLDLTEENYLYLEAAERNAALARDVLLQRPGSESEAALHVVRGWNAFLRAIAANPDTVPGLHEDFLTSLDTSILEFPKKLSKTEWNSELRRYQRYIFEVPTEERLDSSTVQSHLDFLDGVLRSLRRQMSETGLCRASAGGLLPSARFIAALVVALLTILAGYFLIPGSVVKEWRAKITGTADTVEVATDEAAETVVPESDGPAWRGEYFLTRDLTGPESIVRRDERVDFDWGLDAPHPAIPKDNFSVRWDTCLEVKEPVKVNFRLGTDDGGRLIVNGETLIESWLDRALVFDESAAELSPGKYHLRIEYYEGGLGAIIKFRPVFEGHEEMPIEEWLTYPGNELSDTPCQEEVSMDAPEN